MSLTVTVDLTLDAAVVRRGVVGAFPALADSGVVYDLSGDQLTLYALVETDRMVVEQVIADCVSSEAEKASVIAAYQSNLAFIDATSLTTAQVVAQVKALTRQMNYIARVVLDA